MAGTVTNVEENCDAPIEANLAVVTADIIHTACGADVQHVEAQPVWQLAIKRIIDVAGSIVALLLLAPAGVLIAAAIKLESNGPLIYGSKRVGLKGRRFTCYKFRTMVPDADEQLSGLRHLNERGGILFKISNDPRVTRIGRFLRKYSLDEMPQFFNILSGDMSLVGPRPALVSEVEKYPPDCMRRLDVMPGLTGMWQVYARRESSWESYIRHDLEYVNNWSLWLDLKLLFRTIPAVLRGTGE